MKVFYAAWLVITGLWVPSAYAQTRSPLPAETLFKKERTFPGPQIRYYASGINESTTVPPPTSFLKRRGARTSATTATFIVTYNGFSPEAQQSFQRAVDIWSTLVSSPVPIHITANWTTQQANVLGSAGPSTLRLGSDGTQKAEGLYGIALAEKIARRPLNSDSEPDISASFNKSVNWYYGIDGQPGAGQYDLTTVVLHELCHGLGFLSTFTINGTTASYFSPTVFDHFLENGRGQRLLNEQLFPNGSNTLYKQIVGDSLYFNGPILLQQTGQRAKLYAPTSYDDGSSVSHLDERTYPAGSINSLMTPAAGMAEAIHSPGPIVLSIFGDIEWKTTSVLHTPLSDLEAVRDLTFQTRIVSDTGIVAGSPRLFYRKGAPTATNNTFTEVTLTQVGSTDQYTYTLPAAQVQGDIYYYFQVQDLSGRTFTNPGKNADNSQDYHEVKVGPDTVPPTITHTPTTSYFLSTSTIDTLLIAAKITDDRSFGANRTSVIDTAYVEYQINNTTAPALPLLYSQAIADQQGNDSIYVNTIRFGANQLKAGDRIRYRIVARDSSQNRNQALSPATGFYEIVVVAPKAARTSYSSTFSTTATASDFVGYGFNITQPAGFPDPAIHSEHPYRNGSDYQNESNYTYVLLSPIQLKSNSDSAVMRFDEIVLVEPGDEDSKFGDANFYDYVVPEGSRDGGTTWIPLIDGYDSNAYALWLRTFNSGFTRVGDSQNSTGVGTPALYRRRQISLINTGKFQAGESILIRFRLFADQLTNGWGWAIDNLQIQVPPPPPVLAVEEPAPLFSVYPNPTNGQVRIKAQVSQVATDATLSVTTPLGQSLRQFPLTVSGTTINQVLDLGSLPMGIYFFQLQTGDASQTQKVMILN